MTPVSVISGTSPLILAMPHTGTFVPQNIRMRLNLVGLALTDTDWHIDRLYDGLAPEASVIKANFHRYVIDANRDPSGQSLYPGQNTTGLCPLIDFDNQPIYRDGEEPDAAEISQRQNAYHAAYHTALETEIARVRAAHGIAILYDCHSIRSEISFLFEGELPVLNIGTNNGTTCGTWVEETVNDLASTTTYSSVLNGRFKGGWTTRHYGQPDKNIHAIQMEIAQRSYLASETAPWTYDRKRAAPLRKILKDILHALTDSARHHGDRL